MLSAKCQVFAVEGSMPVCDAHCKAVGVASSESGRKWLCRLFQQVRPGHDNWADHPALSASLAE